MLKKALLSLVASAGLMGGNAWAQTTGNEGRLSPLVGAGLTFGGDKLAEVVYTNGNESSITAGGLLDLRVGLDYRFADSPLSIQTSVGYHVSNASARNGDVRFSRVPVELLAHYHVTPAWKIGAGVRKATSAQLSSSGAASTVGDYKFDSNLGLVLEGEYLFTPKFGLKVRYVNEEYEVKDRPSAKKIDGSHAGVIAVYYFK